MDLEGRFGDLIKRLETDGDEVSSEETKFLRVGSPEDEASVVVALMAEPKRELSFLSLCIW